jgi:hypothetical protein
MLLSFAVTTVLSGALAAQPPAPDTRLAGRWRLVPAESDDARARLFASMPRGRFGPGSDRGRELPGARRGGVPSYLPRGRRTDDDPDKLRGVLMLEFVEPLPELTISEKDGTILLLDANENTVVLHPDGKKWKRSGGAVESRTRWKDGDLVCESEDEQTRLTTVYKLATSERLELHYRFRPPIGPDVKVRRVYERAADATPQESPGSH